MKNYQKLDQLTSLRFVAAMMIVIGHIFHLDLFGFGHTNVGLGQGVSFFFVLSGFILFYVYPSFSSAQEIKNFWIARIARIWPAYIASFVLGFVLLHYPWNTKIAISNLLMIQSISPVAAYYFTYNPVTWSISTEVFFYLCFPFLLCNFNRNWKSKCLLVLFLLLAILYFSNYLNLPNDIDPAHWNEVAITKRWLIYVNPISRIFEFVLGMFIGYISQKQKWLINAFWGTLTELTTVLLCIFFVNYSVFISKLFTNTAFGVSAELWFGWSGSAFAFALLILVLAQGKGCLSRFLSNSFLVMLGEISFSIYLIHGILMVYYFTIKSTLPDIPNFLACFMYLFSVFILSYLIWRFIEKPGKRLILYLYNWDVKYLLKQYYARTFLKNVND